MCNKFFSKEFKGRNQKFYSFVNNKRILLILTVLTSAFLTIKAQDYSLNRPHVRIDVTNPPQSTGLAPYETSQSTSVNTQRVQAIFDYIRNNQITYMQAGMSLYTGYSYTVFFPNGTYIFDQTIILGGSYLNISADRAIIQQTGTLGQKPPVFRSTGNNGWQFKIEGLTFDRTGDCIVQENSNLEAGYTRIIDCWFMDAQTAISINKRSCIVTIEYCKFHKCDYVLIIKNVDRCYFKENWVSEKPRRQNGDASIICYRDAGGQRLVVENNLFVPYPPEAGVTETAYINAYTSVQCYKNHFGGESGSKAIINVLGQTNFSPSGGAPITIEVDNSADLNCIDGYTVVRLFTLPNRINIRNNSALFDNTVLVKWAESANQTAEIAKFNSRPDFCKINIEGNIGHRMSLDMENPVAYQPIPKNLRRFLVNKIASEETISSTNNSIKISSLNTRRQYLVDVSVNPHSSGYYRSTYLGILSFYVYYDSGIKAEAILTPLQDFPGGQPPVSSSCNVTVTFDNGSSIIENFSDHIQNINITYGDRVESGVIRIKDLFDNVSLNID